MNNCEGVALRRMMMSLQKKGPFGRNETRSTPIKHQRRLYLTESFSQLSNLMHEMVRIKLCFGQVNFYSLHQFSHRLAYYVRIGVLTRQWEPV